MSEQTPAQEPSPPGAPDSPDPQPEPDGPVVPDRADDDRDRGWGDERWDSGDDDERFLRERPPHW